MQTRPLISFIVTLLLFNACETVVDLEIAEEPPRLVVNFVYGYEGELELSQSKSVLDNTRVQPVSGAAITLYNEENRSGRFEEVTNIAGIYYPPFPLKDGKTYTLRIEKEGLEPVEAMATVPLPVEIKGIDYDTTHLMPNNDTPDRDIIRTNVRIHFNDPGQEHNYYAVLIKDFEASDYSELERGRSTKLLLTYGSTNLRSKDPAIVSSNSQLVQSDGRIYGRTLIFDDHLFDASHYTLHIDLDVSFSKNSTNRGLEVHLLSISEHHFRYVQAQQFQQYRSNDPLAEPIRVPNNIENGFGIFAGYSKDWFEMRFD